MAIEPSPPAVSDPFDPLSHIRGLAQFPNTITAPDVTNDLDSVHHAVKSLGAKNPEKVLEEAKKIVDGGSELLNSDYAAFTSSTGIDEASLEKENEKPQERRPGLGRRRPKFTIKPSSSQPPGSLLTSFDGSKFQDPEEYFAEYLKHENAQKEIKRLMGISSSIDEDNLPQNPLKRRPGILGNSRKSVSYKHRYAEVISKPEKKLVPSPEHMEFTVSEPLNNNSSQGNSDSEVELQDNDAADFVTETEDDVKMMLDELLLSNSEALEGYGAISLLEKRLDVQPINLRTLSIPNFKNTEKIDYVDLGKNLPKPRRSSFAVENFKQETPLSQKQLERSANSSLESSTPRSLHRSMSALRKRVMQSNPLADSFSPDDPDLMVPRSSSPDAGSKPIEPNNGLVERSTGGSLAGMSTGKTPSRQSGHVDVAQSILHSSFLVHDDGNGMDGNMDHASTENAGNDNTMDGRPQEDENVEDAPNLPMSSVEALQRTENDTAISPIDSHELSHLEENVKYAPNLGIPSFEGLKRTENDTSVLPIDNHEPSQIEENVEDAQNLPMPSVEVFERTENAMTILPIDNHEPSQMEEHVKDMTSAIFSAQVDISCKESTIHYNLEVDRRSFDDPHAGAAKECTSEKLPAARVSISEQETEKLPSKDQNHKRRSTVGKFERKSLSRRKSILDRGTAFESGVRRSTRFKTRPLEYWRGERLLYSRVNDSIKLTGLQYISPSKDEGMLKVKSIA